MRRHLRCNLSDSWMIRAWQRSRRSAAGSERSNFAIFAACWMRTRAFTRKPAAPVEAMDLSEKAGTPCSTKSETPTELHVPGSRMDITRHAVEGCVFSGEFSEPVPTAAGDGNYETSAHLSCSLFAGAGGSTRSCSPVAIQGNLDAEWRGDRTERQARSAR